MSVIFQTWHLAKRQPSHRGPRQAPVGQVFPWASFVCEPTREGRVTLCPRHGRRRRCLSAILETELSLDRPALPIGPTDHPTTARRDCVPRATIFTEPLGVLKFTVTSIRGSCQ